MDKLKEWRVAHGLTADEAGARISVSRVQWFRMESGARRPAHKKVLEIEALTGISRHELRPDIFGPAPLPEAAA